MRIKESVPGKVYIGTSGWAYSHWQSVFYPADLPSKNKLKYYSKHFKTIEINYSFYHLPRPATYQKWYKETPADFLFSVKASRFITHIKRLKRVKLPFETFLNNALNLKEKLGPVLFQFPPSFLASQDNIKRLENFLGFVDKKSEKIVFGSANSSSENLSSVNLRFAFEFRHKTWLSEKVYKLLKKYKVAWVIADSPSYPKAEKVTADFCYIRMHGSQVLFSSKYTEKELKDLARKIKKWQKDGLDVYCYFNNDVQGFAIENAKKLLRLCE